MEEVLTLSRPVDVVVTGWAVRSGLAGGVSVLPKQAGALPHHKQNGPPHLASGPAPFAAGASNSNCQLAARHCTAPHATLPLLNPTQPNATQILTDKVHLLRSVNLFLFPSSTKPRSCWYVPSQPTSGPQKSSSFSTSRHSALGLCPREYFLADADPSLATASSAPSTQICLHPPNSRLFPKHRCQNGKLPASRDRVGRVC